MTDTAQLLIPHAAYEAFCIEHVPANPEPFHLINHIPIRDNGEPLVDLRERNPDLLFGEKCVPYVRESVSEMMRTAKSLLPDDLTIKVMSGLRALESQAEMYWSNYKRMQEEKPHWPKSALRRYCNKRWAPPDVKAPPGHCTGGAVDVKLTRKDTGEDLDLTSPYEDWWQSAATRTGGLSEQAVANRRLLCFIMHQAGFSNCRDEYWHWSYGDSAWAVRIGAPEAIYGLIPPPENATNAAGEPVVTPST